MEKAGAKGLLEVKMLREISIFSSSEFTWEKL
jgi:hypothetical protein